MLLTAVFAIEKCCDTRPPPYAIHRTHITTLPQWMTGSPPPIPYKTEGSDLCTVLKDFTSKKSCFLDRTLQEIVLGHQMSKSMQLKGGQHCKQKATGPPNKWENRGLKILKGQPKAPYTQNWDQT